MVRYPSQLYLLFVLLPLQDLVFCASFFFLKDRPPTETSPFSLPDALPIPPARSRFRAPPARRGPARATSCACHTDTGGSSPAASGRGGALHRAVPRAPPLRRESPGR